MNIHIMLGLLIILITYITNKEILRFNFSAVKSFIGLMVLLTFFRLFVFALTNDLFGQDVGSINNGLDQIKCWRLGLVFWEDAVFALTIWWIKDKFKLSKYIWLPITAALSVYFGLGHMYQFEMAFFSALLIPYLFFYRFGVKYGFATTMTCHILFDMFTFLTFKILPFVV